MEGAELQPGEAFEASALEAPKERKGFYSSFNGPARVPLRVPFRVPCRVP